MFSSLAAYGGATVYGVMDIEMAYLSNDERSGLYQLSRNSHIGFKGVEPLGGGFSAIWQIETGLDMMNDTIEVGERRARNSYVGFGGVFGTLLMGRYDTPYTVISNRVDLFHDHLGDARAVTNFLNTHQRASNLAAYFSPYMGGFGLMAANVFSNSVEEKRGDLQGGIYSFAATYETGSAFIGGAYQYICGAFKDGCGSINPEPFDALTSMNIAGSYRFGALKIVAIYADEKLGEIDKQPGNDLFYKYLGIGGAWSRGAHTIKTQYYKTRIEFNNEQDHSSLLALGYDYGLSKKTTIYTEYTRIENPDFCHDLCESVSSVPKEGIIRNPPGPYGLGLGLKVKF
jgi:predicted porin